MAEQVFNFGKFIEDSKAVLLKPKQYFTSMEKTGGFGEPIIKALIYGAISGAITWIAVAAGAQVTVGAMGGLLGSAVGILGFIVSLIGAIIGLFIGAVLVLIVSAISNGSTDFEANTRVVASMMVLSPIGALLGLLGVLSLYLGAVIACAISLYGLYLLYNGVTYALEGKEGTARVVSIVLAIVPVLILISSLVCAKAVDSSSKMMQEYMKGNTQSKDIEDFSKRMEELGKQLEKEMKKAE